MGSGDAYRDEAGAVPVVGVVLLIAITIVVAAVLAPVVIQLGSDTAEGGTAPQARFAFDYDASSNTLTVTHDGGETVDRSRVEFGDDGDGTNVVSGFPDAEITVGDEAVVGGVEAGTKVWVFWNDPEEDRTLPLADWGPWNSLLNPA